MRNLLLSITFLVIFENIALIHSNQVSFIDDIKYWVNPKFAKVKIWIDYEGKSKDHSKYSVGIDGDLFVSGINHVQVIGIE